MTTLNWTTIQKGCFKLINDTFKKSDDIGVHFLLTVSACLGKLKGFDTMKSNFFNMDEIDNVRDV